MMKVYPCGYSIHSAQIAALMEEDPTLLLIDLRRTPDSRVAAWKRPYLGETYGKRYGWFGETLGNVNYKTDGPIKLVSPKSGIAYLAGLLQQGYNLLPFCGCANYETCHRSKVIDLLKLAVPEVEVIFPDQITHPGTVKSISIRQPWAWLICHPEVLKACQLPVKAIENRDWTTAYRGPLYTSRRERPLTRACLTPAAAGLRAGIGNTNGVLPGKPSKPLCPRTRMAT